MKRAGFWFNMNDAVRYLLPAWLVSLAVSLPVRAADNFCSAAHLRSALPAALQIEPIVNFFEFAGGLQVRKNIAGGVESVSGRGDSPGYCLVTGSFVTNPATGKKAHFAAALPSESAWNGKFLFLGCGYNCGEVIADFPGIEKGYTVWATDDGHVNQPAPGDLPEAVDASWAIAAPGKPDADAIDDFQFRAVHTLTGLGKQFVRRAYGAKSIRKSYFTGCSDGGREGMVEATRYPDDYDGIIVGAPYFDEPNEMITTLVGIQAQLRSHEADISVRQFELLGRKVREHCDSVDGVKDGLIQNPAACQFDFQRDLPACSAVTRSEECFTPQQVESLKIIFSAIADPVGTPVFPSFSISDADADLKMWLGFPAPASTLTGRNPWSASPAKQPVGWFWVSQTIANLVYGGAPSFDPLVTPGIRFEKLPGSGGDSLHAVIPTQTFEHIVRQTESGTSSRKTAEIDHFLQRGKKLLMYHGYSDGLITPYRTIQYYRALARRRGGYEALKKDAVLFMAPGMQHCNGGPGPNAFGQRWSRPGAKVDADHDVLLALERWVEQGKAPVQIIATQFESDESDKVVRTMPLCPFPGLARYRGAGSISDASSWTCPAQDRGAEEASELGVRSGVRAELR